MIKRAVLWPWLEAGVNMFSIQYWWSLLSLTEHKYPIAILSSIEICEAIVSVRYSNSKYRYCEYRTDTLKTIENFSIDLKFRYPAWPPFSPELYPKCREENTRNLIEFTRTISISLNPHGFLAQLGAYELKPELVIPETANNQKNQKIEEIIESNSVFSEILVHFYLQFPIVYESIVLHKTTISSQCSNRPLAFPLLDVN